MSYSKAMPANIKPYPLHHQLENTTYDMSYHHHRHQQQAHYSSVYRPAYHRIPSTPAIAPRKEVWANMSPEVSPIVPSMSAASVEFYQSAVAAASSNFVYQHQYYRQPVVPSNSNYHHHQHHHTQIVGSQYHNSVQIPIHHTLENATITYDTVEQDFQKDLVKDVFFSPAMIHHGREMSPSTDFSSSCSASSTCAQSDNEESDDVSVVTPPHFSTPSEDLLLLDTHLFDFGLDLATASSTSNQTTTSSYEEVMMAASNKKKPTFTLSLKNKFDLANNQALPTPPADFVPQNKRRCSDSVLQDRVNKKQRHNMGAAHLRSTFHNSTPPTSPSSNATLRHETIFESGCDYFDDASGEESDDDEDSNKRSTLGYNQFGNQSIHLNTATSEYQTSSVAAAAIIALSDDSDSFSTTSWEEDEEASSEEQLESEEEEDEELKAPIVKYIPTKKYKKSVNNSTIIHPLSKKKRLSSSSSVSSTAELLIQQQLFVQQEEQDDSLLPKSPPRPTATPTIYQKLTKASIDWCRYCGTTEGVNWRPGPWGKRTLCNKHGCDYKGYGFACKLPRLDLTGFTRESIDERERPVLQLYCSGCQRKDSWQGNVLVRCEGCPKAFHQNCCPTSGELTDEFVASKESWFCDANCSENARRKRIVVELPRKRLPLMCAPKSNSGGSSASSVCSESSTTSRPRRESSISSTK